MALSLAFDTPRQDAEFLLLFIAFFNMLMSFFGYSCFPPLSTRLSNPHRKMPTKMALHLSERLAASRPSLMAI